MLHKVLHKIKEISTEKIDYIELLIDMDNKLPEYITLKILQY